MRFALGIRGRYVGLRSYILAFKRGDLSCCLLF